MGDRDDIDIYVDPMPDRFKVDRTPGAFWWVAVIGYEGNSSLITELRALTMAGANRKAKRFIDQERTKIKQARTKKHWQVGDYQMYPRPLPTKDDSPDRPRTVYAGVGVPSRYQRAPKPPEQVPNAGVGVPPKRNRGKYVVPRSPENAAAVAESAQAVRTRPQYTATPYRPTEGQPTRIRFTIAEYDEMGFCIDSFNATDTHNAIRHLKRKQHAR